MLFNKLSKHMSGDVPHVKHRVIKCNTRTLQFLSRHPLQIETSGKFHDGGNVVMVRRCV